MADEPINTPTPTPEPINRVEERITDLSLKVKETASERDAEKAAREAAERERDFFKGYSDVVATNPAAKDHMDEIKTKVMGGYTVEDATFAVLGKAGKIGVQTPAPASPAGGSAANAITGSVEKPVGEMTLSEKRAKLAEEIIWQ